MEKHTVQVLVVHQVEVEATDELQAEIEAYKVLRPIQRKHCIAVRVLEQGDAPGALRGRNIDSWKYAREHFHALDEEWVGTR